MSRRRFLARRVATIAVAVATVTAASGCFTSIVKSGAPAAAAAIEHDEKWHSGLIYGIVELSGPYDLSRICPNGWAEIKTETSFVNGLVQLVTWNIYNPQSVTVRCASGPAPAGGPAMAPPPPGAAPPPPPPSPPPPPAH
jgi:hypothetical protein